MTLQLHGTPSNAGALERGETRKALRSTHGTGSVQCNPDGERCFHCLIFIYFTPNWTSALR